MNRSGLTLSGYTWKEAQALEPASFVVPLDRERLRASLASVLEGKTVLGTEYTAVKKDGSLFPMAVYSCPILKDGEVVGIRGIGVDISERKAAEEEIRKYAQTQATLLSEVNHRVKNNLSAIIGLLYAERQTAREADSGIPAPAFDDLISRVHGLAAVHEMLSAAEWRALNVAEVVTEVIRGLLNGLPAKKRVALEVTDSELRIGPLMAPKLSLLVNELATNTLKYALRERHSARIDVAVAKEKGSLVLEYRDDGPGYPEEVLAGRGRGAGLYIAETIVRRDLRGEILFRNEAGAVAVARLSLAGLGGHGEG
jgi:PAS domain S-box-containing protein